ncbi:hypothetical protein [uncultured Mediterranean phage]|nr:hypothetical protein [uncultured Mediterranean phage]
MNVIKIVFIIVIILLIYIIYALASSSEGTTLIDMHDAKVSKTIVGSEVPSSVSSQDTGYSFWAVVDDWSYNYGANIERIIFQTGKNAETFSPKVLFDGTSNNIKIMTKTKKKENVCIVEDIPIQKWFNIIISYNNRALDVYMDGKLIKTCLIEGDIEDYQGQNIILTPDAGTESGSFDGFLAKFKKFEKAVTPREAWSVYKEGYTKGGFLGILNTFGLKMEVTKAGKTMTGFEI